MAWLFNLVYLALIAVAFPWLLYARIRYGKYREGWPEKLWGLVPIREGEKPCCWIHAVSVGEVNLLVRIVHDLRIRYPEWDFVISVTTSTGFELAKKRFPDLLVTYAPLDFSWAVNKAIQRLRPSLLLLAELEVWPNLLHACEKQGVNTVVINGRLSEKSFRGYQRAVRFIRSTFAKLDAVVAQNETYASRFIALGVSTDAVSVSGSLKFDRAEFDRKNSKTLLVRKIAGLRDTTQVFLAGSTQIEDETAAIIAFKNLTQRFENLRLILVPRHQERFAEVAKSIEESGLPWTRRSEWDENKTADDRNWRILLVDTIGELGAWWGTANVAFVGGAMGKRGGQNMIEPAAFGAVTCFGPNTRNFRDIVSLLLEKSAAEVVRDPQDLEQLVARSLTDSHFALEMGKQAADLIRSQQGATLRTLDGLKCFFEEKLPAVAEAGKSGIPAPKSRIRVKRREQR